MNNLIPLYYVYLECKWEHFSAVYAETTTQFHGYLLQYIERRKIKKKAGDRAVPYVCMLACVRDKIIRVLTRDFHAGVLKRE